MNDVRLIDANALWEELKALKKHNADLGENFFQINVGLNQAIGALNRQPTVKVVGERRNENET